MILMNLFTQNYDVLFLAEITFISYMVAMIPLLPGGLGSFEATMSGLLLAMQLPLGVAAAITILFRFVTFWFVIIISLIFIGIWKLRVKNLERKNIKKLPNLLTFSICQLVLR